MSCLLYWGVGRPLMGQGWQIWETQNAGKTKDVEDIRRT